MLSPFINPLGFSYLLVWTVGLLLVCREMGRRFHWTVALAFGATLFSALRIQQFSLNGIPADPVVREFVSSAQSATVALCFTLLIVQAVAIPTWLKVFRAITIFNAVAICLHYAFLVGEGLKKGVPLYNIAGVEPWGILLNASMSGCLNAAVLPLFDLRKRMQVALVLVSIVLCGRSLPIAVFFTGVGAVLFAERRYKALLPALPISLILGFLAKGQDLFYTRGRAGIWQHAYFYFRDHLHALIGSGLGGFFVIGPVLNAREDGVVFVWLHSDWLQILFEEGVIGFVCVLLMYGYAFRRALPNPRLFGALAAFAMFGVANMPLRYPISGLLGAFLIRWATEKTGPLRGASSASLDPVLQP